MGGTSSPVWCPAWADLQGDHHPPAEILNTAHLCPLGNREAHTLPRSANMPTSVPLSDHSLRPLRCWAHEYPVGYWSLLAKRVPCVQAAGTAQHNLREFEPWLGWWHMMDLFAPVMDLWFNFLMVSSVQFSHSFISDSLQPHGLQHTRPPCPSATPRAYSNSCPLSQ